MIIPTKYPFAQSDTLRCRCCDQLLFSASQPDRPYVKTERGEIVGLGISTLVECHNPSCPEHNMTLDLRGYYPSEEE